MAKIFYKKGYEYQLFQRYTIETGIRSNNGGGNDWVYITPDGLLTIAKGYAWDGPSGPALDTPNFLRGSLVHDALYQLIRTCVLREDTDRIKADKLLQQLVIEDGMSTLRAWWVYQAVAHFGGIYMRNKQDNTLSAP
jgi:hypothetical protein